MICVHVELGDTTEEDVKRELIEAISKEFEIIKFLGDVENYFVNKRIKNIKTIKKFCFFMIFYFLFSNYSVIIIIGV